MTSDHTPHDAHTAFDDAACRAHVSSLDHLSPRVQAQLAVRRRAASTQANRPAASVRVWPLLALGSAAALTLAVGLFVLRGTGDTDTPAPTETVATTPDVAPPATDPDTSARMSPTIASTDMPRTTVENVLVEDDILPAELLAAEFGTADATIGFDAQEETPDFYLWLGSQDAQANVTEAL